MTQLDRRLVAHLRRHAVPIAAAGLEEAEACDVELLSWMDPLVDGKRFAFVGEANHFVHEKTAYRLLLTRYLHSRGFGVLVEELAWSDGVRIDRYLATGDESWLDRIGTFGYEGDERSDRDDRAVGYLAEGREHYPTAAFAHEHRRWLRSLRRLEGAPDRRFFGMDVDYQPGAGYMHLREHLEQLDHLGSIDAAERAAIEALATPVPGETLEAEIERLSRLTALTDRLEPSLRRTARSLRDGYRYVALVRDAPDLESLRPGMASREAVMHEQVDHIVERAGKDARFIVFAHNLHLAAADASIERPEGAVGPGGDRAESVGAYIRRRHPGEVFSVWMLDYEGRDSQPFVSLGNEVRAGRHTLNAALARAGAAYLLPTRAAGADGNPLARPLPVSMIYGHTVTLDITEHADVLFFSRRVSPLHGPAPDLTGFDP